MWVYVEINIWISDYIPHESFLLLLSQAIVYSSEKGPRYLLQYESEYFRIYNGIESGLIEW